MRFTFAHLPEPIKAAIRTQCDHLGAAVGICKKLGSKWDVHFTKYAELLATLELTNRERNQLTREYNEGLKQHWNPSPGLKPVKA